MGSPLTKYPTLFEFYPYPRMHVSLVLLPVPPSRTHFRQARGDYIYSHRKNALAYIYRLLPSSGFEPRTKSLPTSPPRANNATEPVPSNQPDPYIYRRAF